MNTKGNKSPQHYKAIDKYWAWDEWKHTWSNKKKEVRRMERHMVKQQLKEKVDNEEL